MLASSIPAKFPIPFGNSAGGGFIRSIPTASQIGINPGFASLTDGFPPLNFSPVAAGGIPPFGQDFNGLLNQVTKWNQWQAAGGGVAYDAAFATAIGGYPKYALLSSVLVFGNYWLNTVDNNMTDPDSSSASNWISPPTMFGTGSLYYTVPNVLPTGWVWAKNSYTIGSAASGANYAAADAAPLYAWHWNNFPNSQCPVSGGRGANPAADFAANKTMQVLDLGGRGIMGQDDGSNRLAGVPVTSGSANSGGAIIGENFHVLTVAELAVHSHSGSATTGSETVGHTHSGSSTTGSQNANHTHPGSGTTGDDAPDHTHQVSAISSTPSTSGITAAGVSAQAAQSTLTTGGASARHVHVYSFNTGIESAVHQHGFSLTTGNESAAHQHGVFFTTDNTGNSNSHNTVQLSMTVNWILKL